jgi:hypothetical protein
MLAKPLFMRAALLLLSTGVATYFDLISYRKTALWWYIPLFLIAMIATWIYCDKRQIAQEAVERGWRDVKIKVMFPHYWRNIFVRRDPRTHFRVFYTSKENRARSVDVAIGFFCRLEWLGEC